MTMGDVQQREFDVILFDLDGTLYPTENGFERHVRQNVFKFMHEVLGVPEDETESTWLRGFKRYNQTLKGLRSEGFEFDVAHYWEFIRSGMEEYLRPDSEMRVFVDGLPQRKWVFTNCAEKQAQKALGLLGLEGCFEGVVGADFMGDSCKPDPAAFQKVLQHVGADPRRTIMFEDSLKNLVTAHGLGITTVLISGETAQEEASWSTDGTAEAVCDMVVPAPHAEELKQALPNLWRTSA